MAIWEKRIPGTWQARAQAPAQEPACNPVPRTRYEGSPTIFFSLNGEGKFFFNRLKHKTFNCQRSLLLSPLKTSLIMLSHVHLFTSP